MAEPTSLGDEERIVLVGSTFIEREQRHGYWETELRSRYPGKKLTIRNLGWSGDTVRGTARAMFKSEAVGFDRLKTSVLELKPTVIILGYGTNESFAGKEGLDRFEKDLIKLLDALAPAKAKMILFSPLPHESLGPPLPDAGPRNEQLRRYANRLKMVAKEHGHRYVDLLTPILKEMKPNVPLTSNGMHLTAFGYWKTAPLVMDAIFGALSARSLGLKDGSQIIKSERLPRPPMPTHAPVEAGRESGRLLRADGLKPGRHELRIDGEPVHTATAKQWSLGIHFSDGPEFARAEKLRQAILAKNRLHFHRWRPQNVTYLFGFRKHEQGQNAKEIPQFDKLIEAKDQQIAELTKPKSHRYTLTPAEEK